MKGQDMDRKWMDFLCYPLGRRAQKPRSKGLTMVIDKGLGLEEIKDLLHVSGAYIDFIKLGFGTTALYTPEVLAEKIDIVRMKGIDIYPGGTFLEIALIQDKLPEYLQKSKELGFSAIEISDGTIDMSKEVREKVIRMAAELNFTVLTEVGKKEDSSPAQVSEMVKVALKDMECGAHKVILEGRESGTNVGLYNEQGEIDGDGLEYILKEIGDPNQIIWETPLKEQQQEMILRLGCDVNLGNIPPHEVIALEALRVGLRADTLKSVFTTA